MLIEFDKETKKLIKKVSKKVAKKLMVRKCKFSIHFSIAEENPISVSFETSFDNVYADLNLKDENLSLKEVLSGFIFNKNVNYNLKDNFKY